jgi:hypothetical protein
MNKLAITVVEVDNSEASNIGTIVGSSESELSEKLKMAVEAHFACKMTEVRIYDGLNLMSLKNSSFPIDAVVIMDDEESFRIELQETFLY